VFEIGSVTKVFTAAILAEMAARGQVRIDLPVASFLPEHVRVPRQVRRDITLLDLVTHRSGLPRMPSNFFPADVSNPYSDYTMEQLYEFLSQHELEHEIGVRWEYSNLGMGLLGHALALRAGVTYEQLVWERILEPLGMRETGIDMALPEGAPIAQGHGATAQPVPGWEMPTLAGAGALRSTALDMLDFAAANIHSEGHPLSEVLRTTHEVRMPGVAEGLSMCMGWLLNQRHPDRPILWHNGGTGGFHSFIGLDQQNGRAVVVLTNGIQSIDDIGFHLLDDRSPLSPPPPLGDTASEQG
jgi:CubicO group peptidase (beta-lactamase class C family)